MTYPAPSPDVVLRVQAASSERIRKTLRTSRRFLAKKRWLQLRNRYRLRAVETIKADLLGGIIAPRDLIAYVAASGPLHCADAWAYLGRSISAHLNGDREAALHLAYYAELRASVSILAMGGIGVMNKQHPFVDSAGVLAWNQTQPTHVIAWDALRAWAELPVAGDLVARIITPGGLPLRDWLDTPTARIAWRQLAAEWISDWGTDLTAFMGDRNERNEVSYRPSGLSRGQVAGPADLVPAVSALWRSLEPSSSSPYDPLDIELLRSSLQAGFLSSRAAGSTARYDDFVTRIVEDAPIGSMSTALWTDALTSNRETPASVVLAYARMPANATEEDGHLPVMSRALLLLRVATGICRDAFREVGIGEDTLAFWTSDIGTRHGVWDPGGEPDSLLDLWTDVEVALAELETATTSTPSELWSCRMEHSPSILTLGESERAHLWGMLSP